MRRILWPTLLAQAGAVEPEDQSEIRFRIASAPRNPWAFPAGGWVFSLQSPDRFRSGTETIVGDSTVVNYRIAVELGQ
ncbi:MAG: hypothetical protein FJX77_01590 [Armatimonadetes bacterium]|nr:hypothetical protein [Armatimonadota bacterium]